MAEITSKGLMGLPHYRASRVSTSLYEPIYKKHMNEYMSTSKDPFSKTKQLIDRKIEEKEESGDERE